MDKALWEELLNNLREIANALRDQNSTDTQFRPENQIEELEEDN
jgi:hypothetical protein